MRSSFEDEPVLSGIRLILLLQALLISYPSAIYCGSKLHQNWNAFYMKKRGHKLILLTFIAAAWSPLIEFPYYAIISLVNPHVDYLGSVHEWIIYTSMCSRLFEISFVALRVYLLWFEQNHSDLLLSKGWRVLMDPNFGHTNWFYQHDSTLGNSQWMLKCMVIPSVFVWYTLWGIAFYYRHEYATELAFVGIWLLIHCAFGLLFCLKYSSFMDNLGIRQELKGIITAMAIAIAFVIIVAFITLNSTQLIHDVFHIIMMIVLSCAQTALFWFMIVYPERKWEAMKLKPVPKLKRTSPKKASRVNTLDLSNCTDFDVKTWRNIVSEMEGFTSFCNFLHFEFAAENLLYITEYMGIKQLVKENESMKEALNGKELPFDLDLPDKLQMSCIAKQYRENGTLEVALWDLYQKYVDTGAHLEINVNWSLRERLQSIFSSHQRADVSTKMGEEDTVKALVLLDQAAEAVAHLMNDSFLRFRKTDIYKKLLDHLQKSPSIRSISMGSSTNCTDFSLVYDK